MSDKIRIRPYPGPAGGWGSLRSVENILVKQERLATGNVTLLRQNKPSGFSCVSCSWAKPDEAATFEYCENGAKATAWEITRKRVQDDFFARHTATESRFCTTPHS